MSELVLRTVPVVVMMPPRLKEGNAHSGTYLPMTGTFRIPVRFKEVHLEAMIGRKHDPVFKHTYYLFLKTASSLNGLEKQSW